MLLSPRLTAVALALSSSTAKVGRLPPKVGSSLTAAMLVVIVLVLAEIAVVPPLALVVTATRFSLAPVAL